MKKWALAVAVSALASTAVAGDAEDYSLLRCGIKVGGTYIAYKPRADSRKETDSRLNHVAGMVRSDPFRFPPAAADTALAVTANTVELRLPPKFTFATIGCSWR